MKHDSRSWCGGSLFLVQAVLLALFAACDQLPNSPSDTGQSPAPTADFTGSPLSGEAPLEVHFSDLSVGEITAWTWDFGDGTAASVADPVHVYQQPGSYAVELSVHGPGGQQSLLRTSFILVQVPGGGGGGSEGTPPMPDFSGAPRTGVAPLAVQFTDGSSGEITSWSWDFGDGARSSETSPEHVYTRPGSYDVELAVRGPGGEDPGLRRGYIGVDAATPGADFSGSPLSGDAPLTVQFEDRSSGEITSWSWDFGDGTRSTQGDPAHVYQQPGSYSVELTVRGPGGEDRRLRRDYVAVQDPGGGGGGGSPPSADFNGSPLSGSAPLTVQFTDLSSGTVTGWSWDFGDGSSSSAADPSHDYRQTGSYTVELTVRGPDGTDSLRRTDYVRVQDPAAADVISAFGVDTPGGTGGRVLHVTTLANSGTGSLRAAVSATGPRTVVFDVAGVIDLGLQTLRIEEPYLTIDGHSGPAPGITLIRAGINIRTHDVIVRHMRVRPGDAGQPQGQGWEPDGISVWSPNAHDVLVENCSVSWAVDENISASSSNPPSDSPRRVTYRDCIVSEALEHATHAEVNHSRGALIRGLEVAVEGCFFAYNSRRNPVFRDGATGIVVNNLVYDPKSAALHFHTGARCSVVGNVLVHGSDTASGLLMMGGEASSVFLLDNYAIDRNGNMSESHDRDLTILSRRPYWRDSSYVPLPAGAVESSVLMNAGAWPEARDAIDQRIIQQYRTRTGRIIDSQDQVGGYPH